jgi:hypothetical protein
MRMRRSSVMVSSSHPETFVVRRHGIIVSEVRKHEFVVATCGITFIQNLINFRPACRRTSLVKSQGCVRLDTRMRRG